MEISLQEISHFKEGSTVNIDLENKSLVNKQQKFDIKTEVKIENHDDFDDPIYKDSVSFF